MKEKWIFSQKTSRTAFAFLLVFALIFVRYCYYGFEYFYQLDDYIQYHNYTARGLSAGQLITGLGMLGARPLAGVLDITVWARFFPVMIIGLAVISVMFALSACIFRHVLARHFGTGFVFIVIYSLLPLGFEGTYWMSAATRIVVGLFFASISLLCFDEWCSGGRIWFGLLYGVTQLAAFSMYEQVLAFSFAATVLIAALHSKASHRRALSALFAPIAAVSYFAFTGHFTETSALFSTRVSFVFPSGSAYFTDVLSVVVSQIKSVFLTGGFYTLFKGFSRGMEIMIADFNLIYAAIVIFLCLGLFFTARNNEVEKKKHISAMFIGFFLTAAPIIPFFVIETPWFSMRGAVAAFCGIALFCDSLFHLIFGKLKCYRTITAAVCAAASLIFCVSSVSELHDYRETTRNDTEFVNVLVNAVKRDGYVDNNMKIGLLNVESTYLKEQNFFYHEHIHGVTESGWALTGALETALGTNRPSVVPIAASPMYAGWNRGEKHLSGFEILYLYKNGDLIEITAVPDGNGKFNIFAKDGGIYHGYAFDDGQNGYLVLEQ